MEEPRHYSIQPPHIPFPRPTNRGKPLAHFLCKACLFALVIVLVPLFPSQAPEFISESLVTKFWELIHLLFVGIAVSYGLFCRRNCEVEFETGSNFDRLEHDMSRIFHVSSRSEESHENFVGFDGKRVVQDLSGNPNGFFVERGVENGTVQAWNSQHFRGDSTVVVARPNFGLEVFDESGSEFGYKPLGLPVRSLKPRVRKRGKRESSELVTGNGSGSGSLGSNSIKSFDENSDGKFTDSGSGNSENRFDGALASPSPIPWCSRSARTEMKERLSPVSHPVNVRPLSVDETQFESLGAVKTPSLRSAVSFSSRASSASSVSSLQGDNSLPHSAASEVMMDSKVEDADGKETGFWGSYATLESPMPPEQIKHKARKGKSFRGSSASGSRSLPKPIEHEVEKDTSFRLSSASGSQSRPKPLGYEVEKDKSFRGSSALGSQSSPKPFEHEDMGFLGSSALGSPSLPKPIENKVKKDKSLKGSSALGMSSPSKPIRHKVKKDESFRGSSDLDLPSPLKLIEHKVKKDESFRVSINLELPSPPKPIELQVKKGKIFRGSSALGVPSPPKPIKHELEKDESFQGSSASGPPSPPKLIEHRENKDNRFQKSSALRSPSPPKLIEQKEKKDKNFRRSSASRSPSPPKLIEHKEKKDKSFRRYSTSGSPLPSRPVDDKASASVYHLRGHSLGSFCEDELRGPKDYLKEEANESRIEGVSDNNEPVKSSLKLGLKNFNLRRASLMGRSVRTIRPSKLTPKAENCGNVEGKNVVDLDVETEALWKETTGKKGVNGSINGNTEQSLDCSSPFPKDTIEKDLTREIQEFDDNASVESREEADIEAEMFRLSTIENADTESVHGTRTPDSNEVDKKAGEFIAKFREQIRLQKVASMDRSRGLRFGANNLR